VRRDLWLLASVLSHAAGIIDCFQELTYGAAAKNTSFLSRIFRTFVLRFFGTRALENLIYDLIYRNVDVDYPYDKHGCLVM